MQEPRACGIPVSLSSSSKGCWLQHTYYTQTHARVRMHSGRLGFSQPLNTSKAHLSVERQALCHMLALQKSDIRGLSGDQALVSQAITAVIYVCHPFIHLFGDWFQQLFSSPFHFSPPLISSSLQNRLLILYFCREVLLGHCPDTLTAIFHAQNKESEYFSMVHLQAHFWKQT